MKRLLLLTIFILILPLTIRLLMGDPLLYSTQSYELFLSESPYTLLMNALSTFGDIRILFSVGLGLLSAYLLFKLTPKLGYYRALLILNPLFITLFTTLNLYTIAIPLALLSLKKPSLLRLLAPITALFSPLFALLMLLQLYFTEKKHLIYTAPLTLVFSLLALWPPLQQNIVVAEFGDAFGISLFILVLGIAEISFNWQTKSAALFAVLLILAPFFTPALIALSLFSSWYAAIFIRRLVKRTWLLSEAKTIIPWLAGCLFLFLLISHTLVLANAPPNQELVESLELIEGVVLAPPQLRPIISYYDVIAYDCSDCSIIDRLYETWQFDQATAILESERIRYILITQEMRSGGVWNRDNEGLLLLFHYSNYFTLLSDTDGLQLWRYERSSSRD